MCAEHLAECREGCAAQKFWGSSRRTRVFSEPPPSSPRQLVAGSVTSIARVHLLCCLYFVALQHHLHLRFREHHHCPHQYCYCHLHYPSAGTTMITTINSYSMNLDNLIHNPQTPKPESMTAVPASGDHNHRHRHHHLHGRHHDLGDGLCIHYHHSSIAVMIFRTIVTMMMMIIMMAMMSIIIFITVVIVIFFFASCIPCT